MSNCYKGAYGNIRATGRAKRILTRPLYNALRKAVKYAVDQQIEDGHGVSVVPSWFYLSTFEVNGERVSIPQKDIDAVWPKIMSDLGLMNDGTQTNTWTIRGKEIKMLSAIRAHLIAEGKI